MTTSKELLEKLAELEHEQWLAWVDAVEDDVTSQRKAKWAPNKVPYAALTEEAKEKDREWARKVLAIIAAA